MSLLQSGDLQHTHNMRDQTNVYSYSPLAPHSSDIRLLTLAPGTWDADIECHLHHASLDDKPPYEALPYTWGDAAKVRPIRLHGHRWDVTKNLDIALRHLRLVL
jgi:hypothetical protein